MNPPIRVNQKRREKKGAIIVAGADSSVSWREDYRSARELGLKYETAEKTGKFAASGQGSRKRENQMILVRRGEVVDLAESCKRGAQIRGLYLEQVVAWWRYVTDAAKAAPEHLKCETCGNLYIPLPDNRECPFCRIARESGKTVTSALLEVVNGKSGDT